jgi:fucokinase
MQVRIAHEVLQKVVTHTYAESLLISSIKLLAELAKIGREALMNSDIDDRGHIMLEAWQIHQELDPFFSNPLADQLFAFAESLQTGRSWWWWWFCITFCKGSQKHTPTCTWS